MYEFLEFEEKKKMWVVCPEYLKKEEIFLCQNFGKKTWVGMPGEMKRVFFLRKIRPRKNGGAWRISSFSGTNLVLDVEIAIAERDGTLVLVWELFDIMGEKEQRVCKTLGVLFRELYIIARDLEEYGEDMTEFYRWIARTERELS
ncbi:hypothetical protein MEL_068 [Melbournevirus]|uniref:hypothetical protein n=1 Tax=Melbournevirus TaxID=1560514 RepID=UPI00051F5B33|nr:hypothetical protein MEL_068 [Melbournevirus]AIT54681.1 hypothetical protein MEL_068 [Melbournevirus]